MIIFTRLSLTPIGHLQHRNGVGIHITSLVVLPFQWTLFAGEDGVGSVPLSFSVLHETAEMGRTERPHMNTMNFSLRNHLSPLVAIMTLALGIGLALAVDIITSTFQSKPVGHAIATSSPEMVDQDSPPASVELSCYDFTILPIWHELKRDASFRHALEMFPGKVDCSDLVRVERVEIDGDKFDEFIVWGKDSQSFCGATGNCSVWVFDVAKDRVSKLLSSAGIDVEVEKSKSNGFRNVVVRFNGGNYPDSLFDYKFDGHEYRLEKCYHQDKQTLNKWDESCGDWEDSLAGITR